MLDLFPSFFSFTKKIWEKNRNILSPYGEDLTAAQGGVVSRNDLERVIRRAVEQNPTTAHDKHTNTTSYLFLYSFIPRFGGTEVEKQKANIKEK